MTQGGITRNQCIGFDISPEYVDIANERMEKEYEKIEK